MTRATALGSYALYGIILLGLVMAGLDDHAAFADFTTLAHSIGRSSTSNITIKYVNSATANASPLTAGYRVSLP